MALPDRVKIVEVSPRDGLQNLKTFIPTAQKLELIHRLADSGLPVVEATSFVSPRWVPQMADCREVMSGIARREGVVYSCLVPNLKGFQAACEAGATEIAVFAAASDTFSMKNTNCLVEESFERLEKVCSAARDEGIRVRGYISCVLGCPYEGEVAVDAVVRVVEALDGMGCYEISLGDTIGVGTPAKAQRMVSAVAEVVGIDRLAAHFHDTYGQALANILAVLELGLSVVDSSVTGLGGCPYARSASGNVATEDVVYMLDGMGIDTGVDLQRLLGVGRFVRDELALQPVSRVFHALAG